VAAAARRHYERHAGRVDESAARHAAIKAFSENVDIDCILVSLKAGGVALNLTEASRMFIVDP